MATLVFSALDGFKLRGVTTVRSVSLRALTPAVSLAPPQAEQSVAESPPSPPSSLSLCSHAAEQEPRCRRVAGAVHRVVRRVQRHVERHGADEPLPAGQEVLRLRRKVLRGGRAGGRGRAGAGAGQDAEAHLVRPVRRQDRAQVGARHLLLRGHAVHGHAGHRGAAHPHRDCVQERDQHHHRLRRVALLRRARGQPRAREPRRHAHGRRHVLVQRRGRQGHALDALGLLLDVPQLRGHGRLRAVHALRHVALVAQDLQVRHGLLQQPHLAAAAGAPARAQRRGLHGLEQPAARQLQLHHAALHQRRAGRRPQLGFLLVCLGHVRHYVRYCWRAEQDPDHVHRRAAARRAAQARHGHLRDVRHGRRYPLRLRQVQRGRGGQEAQGGGAGRTAADHPRHQGIDLSVHFVGQAKESELDGGGD